MRERRLPFTVFLLPALSFLLACQASPPAQTAPQAAAPVSTAPAADAAAHPSKVILLSLDGAGAATLQQLHKEGALTAGGFARFYKEGQVADRMVPVNPTLTAVNHISLATGYPAAQTGIVSNRFHAAGAPFLETVSGFTAPIATETLWEAFDRQGKRVGVVTWPGVDATVRRRTADWGLIWPSEPLRSSALISLDRTAWSRLQGNPLAKGLESRSPIQRALAVVGKEGQYGREFELAAVDRSDDGKVNYDAISPLVPGEHAYLRPGDWARIPCQNPEPNRRIATTFCWVKLLSLDPDLGSARVYFNALYENQGYPVTLGMSLAERDLLWPGPPDDHYLEESWQGRPGIDLTTWSEQSERFVSFFGSALRVAAGRADWDLILGYIPSIDEAGHELLLTDPAQPGYSAERRDAFAAARKKVWQSVDRELASLLRSVNLETTTVVVVSDHGMAPVHTKVDPNVLLRDKGWLTAGADGKPAAGTRVYSALAGAIAHIYVDPAAPDRDRLINNVKSAFSGWKEGKSRPIARVLTRREAAAFDLDHPNSGDLVLFAADGYTFDAGGLKSGKALAPTGAYGMHGYPNTDPRMASIYLAIGGGLAPGSAGTVRATDVAGRIAQWLGIEKPRPTVE
jgi:predicted AlkP superfamily pyrophosphatase or phosphodiesterase